MTSTDRKMFSADIPDLLAKVRFDAIDIEIEDLIDMMSVPHSKEREDALVTIIRDNLKKLACMVPKGPDVITVITKIPGEPDQEVTISR